MTDIPYTSFRMLRTQTFYPKSFTQQISSVSTEESQAGVKNSDEHHTGKKIPQTSLHPIKMKRY